MNKYKKIELFCKMHKINRMTTSLGRNFTRKNHISLKKL